jgi:hypothetical protein
MTMKNKLLITLKNNYMTTTTVTINGFQLTVKGKWFKAENQWDYVDIFYKDDYMFTDDLMILTNYDKTEIDFLTEIENALDKQFLIDSTL